MKRRPFALYGMLAPFLIGTLALIGIPGLISAGLAFFRYDGLTPPLWVGLDNFAYISTYRAFLFAVRNTLGFIAIAVPMRVAAMLGLSLLLRRKRRGVGFARLAVFLPSILPDVAYSLMWAWIFNPVFGPITVILQALGIPPIAWIVDHNTVGPVLLVMSLFQVGEGLVILLAGLHQIPNDFYEAAETDGADRWQKFRWITFPLLRPWLLLLTFRDIVSGAQAVFTPAFIMIGFDRYYTFWFLPQMIYEEAFSRLRFGIASAVMVAWLIFAAIFFFFVYRVLRGWGYADEN